MPNLQMKYSIIQGIILEVHYCLGPYFLLFKIYGDFSGYSDIAIGVSRLFGFDLMQNFAFPYFSRDIAEFWRRWHMSLSTWFRDYVYIPLGGSRGGGVMKVRKYIYYFHSKWVLAWSKLDVCSLGIAKRYLLFTSFAN